MRLFEEIKTFIVLFMIAIVISVFILGCGEDEEKVVKAMNSLGEPAIIDPKELSMETPGPPAEIIWIKINDDGSREELKEFKDDGQIKHRSTFIVRVLDANGTPVPDERVEWTLNTWPDGVGDIVDTDDPGHRNLPEVQAAPQIKVENNFAITFTNSEDSVPPQLKGMGKKGEYIVIRKGETWITINSTREGDTDVTASAPAIPRDSVLYEIFGVIHWLDGEVETLIVTPPDELISCLENADNLTGTFSVTNEGPTPAEEVTLTVDYPQEQGITVVDIDGGTNDGDKITWDIGTLPAGDTASRNPIFAASSGGVYDFIEVKAESKCTEDMDTWTVKVIDITATCSFNKSTIELDPAVLFDPDNPSYAPEYIATYTLTVENRGGEAVNATLGLQVPDCLELVSGETEIIILEPGNIFEKSFELKGTRVGLCTVEGTVNNISSVTDSQVICSSLPLTPCEIEVPACCPAMQVEKVDTHDPIGVGELTRYRIIVWNEGMADAYDVTIVDKLPTKLDLVTDVGLLGNEIDSVVCKVELVIVDAETGSIIPAIPEQNFGDGSFNQNVTININEIQEPQIVLSGDAMLTISVVGQVITFNFDRMMPTWAFRISFYVQANAVGRVYNITELTYRDEPGGVILPEGGPSRSDELTTIQ